MSYFNLTDAGETLNMSVSCLQSDSLWASTLTQLANLDLAKISRFSTTSFLLRSRILSRVCFVVDPFVTCASANPPQDLLLSIAQAILLLPSSYWLGISFPFLILAFYLIQRFYLRTSRQLRLLDLEAKSPL